MVRIAGSLWDAAGRVGPEDEPLDRVFALEQDCFLLESKVYAHRRKFSAGLR
jgi:hypothetical protein